jgi:hypothetical protein
MASYKFELNTSAPAYQIELARVGAQGAEGPAGGGLDWITLATAFSSTPSLNTQLVGGDVYTYQYNNDTLTLYRYVTSNSDEFYQDFDGTNLTTLIASKLQSITL